MVYPRPTKPAEPTEETRSRGRVIDFGRGYGFIEPMEDAPTSTTINNSTYADEVALVSQEGANQRHQQQQQQQRPRRIFFHINDVDMIPNNATFTFAPGTVVTYSVTTGTDGKDAAVHVRDGSKNRPFEFDADRRIKVSASGRHVGTVIHWDTEKKRGLLQDDQNGARVYVSKSDFRHTRSSRHVSSLARGQKVEFTPKKNSEEPRATDVTGPMGAPLTEEDANLDYDHRPSAHPKPQKQPQTTPKKTPPPAANKNAKAAAKGATAKGKQVDEDNYDDYDYGEDYDEYNYNDAYDDNEYQ